MNATFKGVLVTDHHVLAALSGFDAQYARTNDYEEWLDSATYKYAIQFQGRLYPCKHILSRATGIDTSEFNGGEQTNKVFRQLGFRVINKP